MIAPKQITVTIDGQKCTGTQGQTILDIATANKIYIPTLCYLKNRSPWGGCRMCIVEIQGSPKVVPSCATPAMDGAVYQATNDRLTQLRRLTLELLFSERNHICPFCAMNNGDCELQHQGYRHGMDSVRYPYLYPAMPTDTTGENFVLDHNRCILCTRCVRTCDEVEGVHTLDVAYRGEKNRIVVDLGGTFGASDTCTQCGACVASCPTGALYDKGQAFRGKLNTCRTVKTTCTECPVGCGLLVFTKENRIVNVFGDPDHPVNQGHLCERGRYETWAKPRQRILEPLLRKNGQLQPVSWDEARKFIADTTRGLSVAQKAMLVSPRVPNEMGPALHRLAGQFERVGTFVGRFEADLCAASVGEKPNLSALRDADAIIVLGAHPSQHSGVVSSLIRVAVRKRGAKLLVFFARRSDLDRYADIAANVVSLERAFWQRVGEVLQSATRPVLLYGSVAMTPVGVTVMERLIEILSAQPSGAALQVIGLPTSTNALSLTAAGIEPVQDVTNWLIETELKYLHVIASDEPDGGVRLVDRHDRALLEKIGCVVVQASYQSALTDMATLVLPAAASLEKAGTLTNLEGRQQALNPVVPARGQAKQDQAILEMVYA
jgi:predicted molibdopterin-dependent oxidoreductase YjgC